MIMRRPYLRTATRRAHRLKIPRSAQASAGQVKEQAKAMCSRYEGKRRPHEVSVKPVRALPSGTHPADNAWHMSG